MTRTVPKGYYMKISKGFYSTEKLYNMLKSENHQWLYNISERLVFDDMYVYNQGNCYQYQSFRPSGYLEYFYSNIGGL